MNIAVLQFPGSNCDQDAVNAFGRVLGLPTRLIWHKEKTVGDAELVVVPGGFSFGDYLRCGAIARFSPVIEALRAHAARGGLVLGICNGFQILCEAGLLPGALIRNRALEFRCETALLAVQNSSASFNRDRLGAVIQLPIAHGEGNYRIDPDGLEMLEKNGQVLLRYCDAEGGTSPAASINGSMNNIAGIRNEAGNVFGMMPHPERAVESFHPSQDGLKVLQAILEQRGVSAAS